MKNRSVCVLLLSFLLALGGCNDDDGPETSACVGECFPNGVAAGDVDQSSVVLWARASFTGTVSFEYGRDPDFVDTPDGVENVQVDDPNVPAKVDIAGLLEGTEYYYRACHGRCPTDVTDEFESRGHFRTPYLDDHHGLTFGVSSCWNGDLKPFVSIRNVPDRDLDFFVALGDTVYADSPATGARPSDLAGYRVKNELHYSKVASPDDNMFALARASTASYVDIDDHEVVNDFAGGAAPSSQTENCECIGNDLITTEVNGKAPCPIPWEMCFCNPYNDPNGNCDREFINETDLYLDGLQAWHEYNPIREERYGASNDARTSEKRKLYRHRTFGKDAAMFMLDTRSFRDERVGILGQPLPAQTYDPSRTMLGSAQFTELINDLQGAEDDGITWKFVMVPEPMQNLGIAGAGDRFEGYAYERGALLEYIERNCITNVVFVSGDIHGGIANNLTYDQSVIEIQKFSAAWGISTGPGGYAEPLGVTLTGDAEGRNRSALDGDFRLRFDILLRLQNAPWTGFGLETFNIPPGQQHNRFIPATLLKGDYVAAHTYGWTEFDIDPGSQVLRVTTYGVDWYGSDLGIADILLKEPTVVGRFEVEPRYGCQGCGDNICDPIVEKCGGNDSTLLQCRSDCGQCQDGKLCGDDNMCSSGLCNVGVCTQPLNNGYSCLRHEGCNSGLCDLGFCTKPYSKGWLDVCLWDQACVSGNCILGASVCSKP